MIGNYLPSGDSLLLEGACCQPRASLSGVSFGVRHPPPALSSPAGSGVPLLLSQLLLWEAESRRQESWGQKSDLSLLSSGHEAAEVCSDYEVWVDHCFLGPPFTSSVKSGPGRNRQPLQCPGSLWIVLTGSRRKPDGRTTDLYKDQLLSTERKHNELMLT